MRVKPFLILVCFFIFKALISRGQNLVPNGDFEGNTSCSSTTHFSPPLNNWINPCANMSGTGSPDYYQNCIGGMWGVPSNVSGFQQPHSGIAYTGLILRAGNVVDYREYMEIKLSNTLIANNCYLFEMYVNNANVARYASKDLGVYFSNSLISGITNYNPLPFTPQVINNSGYITDTLNWVLVSGVYRAVGGEDYIIIGNFKNDLATDTILFNASATFYHAYILIDDVSLTPVSCGPLPVEWIDFTATPSHQEVILNWKTFLELNNDYFIIERSKSGDQWTPLSKIRGSGNSTSEIDYNTIDEHPFSGVSYYRIRQVDFDGSYTYSGIQKISRGNSEDILIYPNPASQYLNINMSNLYQPTLTLYNSLGQEIIYRSSGNEKNLHIDTSDLSSGIYMLMIEADGILVKREKIIIRNR
jgi:hypothetical protein